MKRGMSHIEFIVSFILFAGFVIFGLYFFNPLNNTRVLDSSLAYAFDEIVQNTSTPVLTYTVICNDCPSKVELSLPRGDVPGSGVRVESEEGVREEASYDGSSVRFIRSSGADLYYVRFGDFPGLGDVVKDAAPVSVGREVTISSSHEQQALAETQLRAMKNAYDSDYDRLRESFNLPRRVDFATRIAFDSQDGLSDEIVMTRPKPDNAEVFSHVERREILRKNGQIVFAQITVQIW